MSPSRVSPRTRTAPDPRSRLSSGQPVVVIGAGVIGLSIARELAGRGVPTTIIEAREVGGGASGAAVGNVACPVPSKRSAYARLLRRGWELHGSLAESLRLETGIDTGFRVPGAVHVYRGAVPRREKAVARWQHGDGEARWLDADEAALRVPGLELATGAALWLSAHATIDPGRFLGALRASCVARGVRVVEGAGPARLAVTDGGRATVHGVATGDLSLDGAAIVLAAGAGTLAASLALPSGDLPLRAVGGQVLELSAPAPSCVVCVYGRDIRLGHHLVPRAADRVVVGSTTMAPGAAVAPGEAGRDELLRAAAAVAPELGRAPVTREWAGARPRLERLGGPIIGPWPGIPNVWVACGHFRSGLVAAPSTAEVIADAMLHGEALEDDFALDRVR